MFISSQQTSKVYIEPKCLLLHRYIRYPTVDLSSQTLGEEKDLKLYVRAARLADGEDAEPLSTNDAAAMVASRGGGLGNEEIVMANQQFYETWLRA